MLMMMMMIQTPSSLDAITHTLYTYENIAHTNTYIYIQLAKREKKKMERK